MFIHFLNKTNDRVGRITGCPVVALAAMSDS